MNETKGGSAKRRKALSATLAVITAFVMLLSGTLAYFYQTRAVNTIKGEEQQKLVVGHDDFVKTTRLANGAVEYNKDVYVENIGDTSVFVRVKLSEELTIGENTIKAVHNPASAATLGVGTAQHDTEATGDFHDYFKLNFGNTGSTTRKTYLSASAKAYTDGHLEGVETVDGVAKDSSNTAYSKTDADGNPIADKDIYSNIKNLSYGQVITMEEFFDENKTDEWRQNHPACWIIDNSPEDTVTFTDAEGNTVNKQVSGGGWAYWSKMLKPGEQTTVLLNSVIVDSKIAGTDYTYNINVDFESVDKTDQNVWLTGQTTANEGQTTGIRSDLASKKARQLLEWAGSTELGAYTDENEALIADLVKAKKEATSACTKKVYNYGIIYVNDYVKMDDQALAYTIGKIYQKIGDEIEELRANKDETLDDPVIVLDGDGTVKQSPEGMQDALAKRIVKTADLDNNGTVTVEEALAMTNFEIGDAELTSLDGLKMTQTSPFRNIVYFFVLSPSRITSFDGNNFTYTDKNGEQRGLINLEILDQENFSGEINLAPLAGVVKRIAIRHIYGITEFKGLDQLNKMQGVYIEYIRKKKESGTGYVDYEFSTDTLNTLFSAENSGNTLRRLVLNIALSKKDNQPITTCPLNIPQGVVEMCLSVANMEENGTYTFAGFPKLTTLKVYGNAKPVNAVFAEGACPALQSFYTDYPKLLTITGDLPNGLK